MADELAFADVAASIIELQALLLGTESIEGFLGEVAMLAIAAVGKGLSCGITLQPNGRPLTAVSTDALAAQVDEVQYGLDEGPCLHALRTGTTVYIVDAATDKRWEVYAVRAVVYGVRSSLSLPLNSGGETFGAFNLYSPQPGSFGEVETGRAEWFAQTAAGALAIAMRLAEQVALTDQLRASLASRSVIDQAIGVLMARHQIPADQAFEILRTASQNRNVKVRTLASQIVAGTGGQPPQPPHFDDPR